MKWLLLVACLTLGVVIMVGIAWLVLSEDNENTVSPKTDDVIFHFIDVGQGGAVFIQKDGLNILYDCGDTFAGSIVIEYLNRLNVDTIDILIPSHAHEDHIAGCLDVLRQKEIKTIYHNGSQAETRVWQNFLHLAENANEVFVVENDFEIHDLQFLVAYDSRGRRYSEEANNSIVVRVVTGDIGVLLTGDCEMPCEHEIAKNSEVRSDILNVGHHGSSAASGAEFLAIVTPHYAIIQAGFGNQYGHPRREVLDRLETVGAQIYRTDQMGTITITIRDGKETTIETER